MKAVSLALEGSILRSPLKRARQTTVFLCPQGGKLMERKHSSSWCPHWHLWMLGFFYGLCLWMEHEHTFLRIRLSSCIMLKTLFCWPPFFSIHSYHQFSVGRPVDHGHRYQELPLAPQLGGQCNVISTPSSTSFHCLIVLIKRILWRVDIHSLSSWDLRFWVTSWEFSLFAASEDQVMDPKQMKQHEFTVL